MEPLAAVALAGNVLQFAEFVGKLLKNTSKIYTSASGLTPNDLHIQDICGKLSSFSAQLQSVRSNSSGPLDEHLRDCVVACKKDCDDLLAIMRVLASKKGNSQKPWKSFSAALSHQMKAGETQDLKDRIEDHQHLISLILTNMLNERARVISKELSQLQSTIKDWTDKAAVWFERLSDTQKSVSQQIEILSRQIKTPDREENALEGSIERVCSGLRGLSIETQECQQTMNILNSLDYQERSMRHSAIPEAHRTTFGWALRQDESNVGHDASGSLRRWLQGDSNLFWVSGKPGSGKSTFMKFAADHEKTPESLRHWTGHGELVLAKHFFTIYGTTIQRSQEGLLRSLLHNILEGEPALMQRLLPGRWASTSTQSHWELSELGSTLRAVANAHLSVHICFFIDGLDEYSGDHLEICQMIKKISESPFIKVCVSSRPWNVFEDAFGNSGESKLYMHELTHEDILQYVRARVEEHPRWGLVSSGPNASESQSLINEVADRSMGVFLWVFLVTRLLREGLNNDDSFSELRKRVSSYPDDLEKFFKHILGSVDRFYYEKMAGTLMIARDAEEPLATEIFMFHDHEYDDENYALHDPADHERLDNDCQEASMLVSRRINGRCKGLLERQGGKMVFLHRTVFDFLQTPDMARFLQEKARANFCSHLSLLRAQIAWFKRSSFHHTYLSEDKPNLMNTPAFVQSLREAAQYARLASKEGGSIEAAVAALLDNADVGIVKMVRTGQIRADYESTAVKVYRLLLLEGGVEGYVDSKLSTPGYLRKTYAFDDNSPLCFALDMAPRPSPSDSPISIETQPRLLESLLKLGHDPNKAYGIGTLWTTFLDVSFASSERFGVVLKSGVLETLLRYGADPTEYVSFAGEERLPFWLCLLLCSPLTRWNHQLAFEKVWILTLERIPTLIEAKFLESVLRGFAWTERDFYYFWGAMHYKVTVESFMKQPQSLDSRYFFMLLKTVLDGLRDSPTAFEQSLAWFARSLRVDPHELVQRLPSGLQDMNFRKRLAGEDSEGGGRTTKARRLM